jgi:S-adenosylmethionine/arginine decarboxylase-like enzyme
MYRVLFKAVYNAPRNDKGRLNMKEVYGKELIIDLHKCNVDRFNRKDIRKFFRMLCALIDVEAADCHFWDDEGVPEDEKQTDPHTTGTSAVQFILTSNITIHTLDILKNVYLNIFSCDDFDEREAVKFTKDYFGGTVVNTKVIERK